ncbi:hypothetical protein [Nereida ignava]|uniref:hypothetical protein n=1 Tax=Nereida ignava TaxID=282199 RepID=UPI0030F5576D
MSQPDLRAYETTLDDEVPTASSPKRFKKSFGKAGPVSKGGQAFKTQSAQEIAKEKREQEKLDKQAKRLADGKRLDKRNEFERGYNYSYKLTPLQEEAIRDEWYGKAMYWGRDKLYKLLAERDDLQGNYISRRQVISWLSKQETYQRHLPFKPDTNVHKSVYPMKPGVLQLDNLTYQIGNKNVRIFMAIDVFTHYMWAFVHQTKKAGTEASVDMVKRIQADLDENVDFPDGLSIKAVWTDSGPEFVATITRKENEFGRAMRDMGIRHILNPSKTHAHHAERANRTFRMLLSKSLESKRQKETVQAEDANIPHNQPEPAPAPAPAPSGQRKSGRASKKPEKLRSSTLQASERKSRNK